MEIDLNPVVADPAIPEANPIARLMNARTAATAAAGVAPRGRRARDRLRARGPRQAQGADRARANSPSPRWSSTSGPPICRTRSTRRATLLGQGLLTPEVHMLIGDEIQARAEAEAAIEIARAAARRRPARRARDAVGARAVHGASRARPPRPRWCGCSSTRASCISPTRRGAIEALTDRRACSRPTPSRRRSPRPRTRSPTLDPASRVRRLHGHDAVALPRPLDALALGHLERAA